jgi:mRNA interferase MazF
VKRGDIYLVDFNPAKGGEMGKLRPAIVVSDALDNESLETVMVIPLSTRLVENAAPYRYRISARKKLKEDSDACIYEIRTLAKNRLREFLGTVTAEEYGKIREFLCTLI